MKLCKLCLPALVVAAFLLVSCKQHYSPKPYGYFRIDLPTKEYKAYDGNMPYSFELPVYAFITSDSVNREWSNIEFPLNNATVYMTYKALNNDFARYLEESREFVYKHTVKADAINESFYGNDDKKVYGILYDIKGNTASSVQFFITDSTDHFLRGSLYFNSVPNKDSLGPVIEFIRADIVHMMETFSWKKCR